MAAADEPLTHAGAPEADPPGFRQECPYGKRQRERQDLFAGRARKRPLWMFNVRIFDSSVERGIRSRAAAPDGPNTRPPVARSASSMSTFSCDASVLDMPRRLSTAGFVDNQLSSTVNSSVSDTITDRSMTFCNSRTFPGHGYAFRRSRVRLLTRRMVLPAFRA